MPVHLYLASAVQDAAAVHASPGAVAIHNGRVLAAGDVDNVRRIARETAGPDAPFTRRELPGRLLLPGLVNAHAHLDLTALGYHPYIGNFARWIRTIIRDRPTGQDAITASVRQGVRQSLAAGVLTIGDIAGSPTAAHAFMPASLTGVTFLEHFGPPPSRDATPRWSPTTAATRKPCRHRHGESTIRLGIQPHAPYSAHPQLYRWAARQGRPLTTHLAETTEELEFTEHARGPLRDLLHDLERWHPAFAESCGRGRHPVDHLLHCVGPDSPPWLCAHCNYLTDRQIDTLARLRWSVAYCPRASDYFNHRGHPYRRMLDAGVNVCLGTDSILCHGTLSIFDEMRHLHRRDRTDPALLLKMATLNGMRALGLDERHAAFTPGAASGLIALRYDPAARRLADSAGDDALSRILAADRPPDVETLHTRPADMQLKPEP